MIVLGAIGGAVVMAGIVLSPAMRRRRARRLLRRRYGVDLRKSIRRPYRRPYKYLTTKHENDTERRITWVHEHLRRLRQARSR